MDAFAALGKQIEDMKRERRLRQAKEFCYFIQRPDRLVKIGYTHDVSARMISLKSELRVDVTLLGVIKGGRALEKLLHTTFKDLKVEGEWYSPKAELLQYIAENAKSYRPERKDKEVRPSVIKERKPRIVKPKVDKRRAKLITRMGHSKEFVRQRAYTDFACEYRAAGFDFLLEQKERETSPKLKQWINWIIKTVEEYDAKKKSA